MCTPLFWIRSVSYSYDHLYSFCCRTANFLIISARSPPSDSFHGLNQTAMKTICTSLTTLDSNFHQLSPHCPVSCPPIVQTIRQVQVIILFIIQTIKLGLSRRLTMFLLSLLSLFDRLSLKPSMWKRFSKSFMAPSYDENLFTSQMVTITDWDLIASTISRRTRSIK